MLGTFNEIATGMVYIHPLLKNHAKYLEDIFFCDVWVKGFMREKDISIDDVNSYKMKRGSKILVKIYKS